MVRRPRSSGERGAAAVEAALIAPLLFLLIFGMIEFSLALRDYSAVSSAVRTGARIASTGAGAGPGSCADLPPESTCAPTSSPALVQAAADAIQKAGTAMPADSVQRIMVYKANQYGYPGDASVQSLPESCAGMANCVEFTWMAAQDKFRYASGSWASTGISACFPGTVARPLDSVGVAMTAEHEFITGIFGRTITLTDHMAMKFEPLATELCAPGEHS